MFEAPCTSLLALAIEHPALQAVAIIIATFVLEDAATILAATQVQDGSISGLLAIASLYVGIVLGDAGLYGLGWLASLVPWVTRVVPTKEAREWLQERVFKVVWISRFLPGLRLPTYTACGFLGARFSAFILASMTAALVWTTGLFVVSIKVGDFLMAHFGLWRWAGAMGTLVFLLLASRFIARSWKCGHQQ